MNINKAIFLEKERGGDEGRGVGEGWRQREVVVETEGGWRQIREGMEADKEGDGGR